MMETSHIIKSLLRNKSSFILLSLQVAITLAVLINALALVKRSQEIINQDTGMDAANIIAITSIPFAREYNEASYGDAELKQDLRALRNIPGVNAVSSVNFIPTAMGSNSSVRADQDDASSLSAGAFTADESTLRSLGLEILEGRDFRAEEIYPSPWPSADKDLPQIILLSKELAEGIFPDQSAVGQSVRVSGTVRTVVGVVSLFRGRNGILGETRHNFFVPGYLSGTKQVTTYLVRTETGLANSLMPQLEDTLLMRNNGRDIDEIILMEDQISISNGMYAYGGMVLLSISALLIVTTALGIFGTASFSVTKRIKQIGTRRALGATKGIVFSYFIIENLLTTLAGIFLGLFLAIGLNIIMTRLGLGRIDSLITVAGTIFVIVVGLVAVTVPAYKAASIAPAEATRS